MQEITVSITAFEKEYEVKIIGFQNIPQDRLKTLAIDKFTAELRDVLLQENGVTEKTSYTTSKDYI